jgi:hypothetical protein
MYDDFPDDDHKWSKQILKWKQCKFIKFNRNFIDRTYSGLETHVQKMRDGCAWFRSHTITNFIVSCVEPSSSATSVLVTKSDDYCLSIAQAFCEQRCCLSITNAFCEQRCCLSIAHALCEQRCCLSIAYAVVPVTAVLKVANHVGHYNYWRLCTCAECYNVP